MAHLIQSFEDLLELLEQQPDLRPRLLRVLLTEDFLQLPQRVDRLEEVLTKLTHQVFLLAESHRELAESHRLLREGVEVLAQGQRVLVDLTQQMLQMISSNTNSINSLARTTNSLTHIVESLAHAVASLAQKVDSLDQKVDSVAISQKEMRQEIKERSERVN